MRQPVDRHTKRPPKPLGCSTAAATPPKQQVLPPKGTLSAPAQPSTSTSCATSPDWGPDQACMPQSPSTMASATSVHGSKAGRLEGAGNGLASGASAPAPGQRAIPPAATSTALNNAEQVAASFAEQSSHVAGYSEHSIGLLQVLCTAFYVVPSNSACTGPRLAMIHALHIGINHHDEKLRAYACCSCLTARCSHAWQG